MLQQAYHHVLDLVLVGVLEGEVYGALLFYQRQGVHLGRQETKLNKYGGTLFKGDHGN